MAIIYSYPTKGSPAAAGDLLLISDSADSNKTKSITVQSIADFVDGEVTLQEVLDTGSSALENLPGGWGGVMSLAKSGAPAVNITLDVNAASGGTGTAAIYTTNNAEIGGDLRVTSEATVVGDLVMEQATSDIIMSKGNIQTQTASDLNFVVTTGGQVYNFDPSTTDIDFNVGITSNRIRNANWELDGDFDLNAIGNVVFDSNTQTIRSGGDAIFASTGADTVIGANDTLYLGKTTGIYEPVNTVIHAEQTITLTTDTSTTNFKLNGSVPQIESNSDHQFIGEIRLPGSATPPGSTGEVIKSEGVGNNPIWADPTSLLTLPSTQIYAGDVSNVPAATNFITVDVPNNDITLGTNATQTLVSGGARYNTDAGTGTGLGSGNANIQFGLNAMAQVYGAGSHINSGLNLAIGNHALEGNVGVGAVCSGNTAIGWESMRYQDMANADLVNNVAIGAAALRGAVAVGSNCGGDNVAIGSLALDSTTNVSARRNVGVGSSALTALTTAESNTAVGFKAGLTQATGHNNTLIGASADGTTNACEEGVAVGKSAKVDTHGVAVGAIASANAVNTIALGHGATTNVADSIAIGAGAVANNPTINLTVVGAPAPAGGLPQHPDNPSAQAAGLTDGDVYVIPVPGGTVGFGAGAWVLAIVHP